MQGSVVVVLVVVVERSLVVVDVEVVVVIVLSFLWVWYLEVLKPVVVIAQVGLVWSVWGKAQAS